MQPVSRVEPYLLSYLAQSIAVARLFPTCFNGFVPDLNDGRPCAISVKAPKPWGWLGTSIRPRDAANLPLSDTHVAVTAARQVRLEGVVKNNDDILWSGDHRRPPNPMLDCRDSP